MIGSRLEEVTMRFPLLLGALALGLAALAGAAMADDPHDPAMRSAAARARDHEQIRQMNLAQLRYVRQRDAQYAKGWRAYRKAHGRRSLANHRRHRQ